VIDTTGWIAALDGRAAGQQSVGERIAAVILQWAEERVDVEQVAGRVTDDGAGGRIADQVVSVTGQRATAIAQIAGGVEIAGDDSIPDCDRATRTNNPAAFAYAI
jgi:hypothetical protein